MLLVFVYFSVCSGTASKEERQRDKEKNDGGGGVVLWVVRWEYAFRKIIIILAKVNTHDPQLPFFFFIFWLAHPF